MDRSKIRRFSYLSTLMLALVCATKASAIEDIYPTISADIQKPSQQLVKTSGWSQLDNHPNYGFTVGYSFTPKKPGDVVALGGYFSGSAKRLRLYGGTSPIPIREVTVSSSNGWGYAFVEPVRIAPGYTYTVALDVDAPPRNNIQGITIGWNGAAMPQTFKDITITENLVGNLNTRPTNSTGAAFVGLVDVAFVPVETGLVVSGNLSDSTFDAREMAVQDPAAEVSMTVKHNTTAITLLRFDTTQEFDIEIIDERGNVVSKWSDGRVFANVVTYVNPKGQFTVSGKIPLKYSGADAKLADGSYTVRMYLTNSNAHTGHFAVEFKLYIDMMQVVLH